MLLNFLTKKTLLVYGLLFVVSTVTVYAGLKLYKPNEESFSPSSQQTLASSPPPLDMDADIIETPKNFPSPPPLPKNQVNILLLGHGDMGHQGGGLTDAITVLHLDADKNQALLISIPRDVWVELTNGKTQKINFAYSQGVNVAKKAVETITGLPIQYLIAVDFYGLTAIVDEMGGIEVDLKASVVDEQYPIRGRELDTCGMSQEEIDELHGKYSGFELEKKYECRFEKLDFPAGNYSVNGETAVKLARSRHGSSDYQRGDRQRAILIAINKKLISVDAIRNAGKIFNQLKHTFRSDIDLKLAISLADMLFDYNKYQIREVGLSTTNVLETSKGPQGQFILSPKNGEFESVKEYIRNQME